MDEAFIMLAALRTKAKRSGSFLSTAEVEALADTIGVDRASLPRLMAQFAAASDVRLVWGGVEVLPAPAPQGERVSIGAGSAPMPGGPTMTVSSELRLGELSGALQQLRALLPHLKGVAGESAKAAEALLAAHPAPDAPDEVRRDWGRRLMVELNELVSRAPESEAILDLAERVQKAVARG